VGNFSVLILGNFILDQQQSMLRFASLLSDLYSECGSTQIVSPPAIVARVPYLPGFARKYLAYIDKLVVFPFWLSFRAFSFDRIHIADHSNAFYSFFCPRGRCIVTCHDLLAMRGAFGDPAAACEASPIGIWLQRLIMAGLKRADAVAFDSYATYADYQLLIGAPARQRHAVIPIPLNAPFSPDPEAFPLSVPDHDLIPAAPFLLMVGSALPRKNRGLALRLLEYLGCSSPYQMVFAGAPLTDAEQAFRASHPLGSRLVSIPRPSHALLNCLYCQAHALLFPSFAEGFGWPLVEAQTCRCPVIASRTTSIPEVAGNGALYADATDVALFAAHVRALEDPSARARLIALGVANTRRFDPQVVGDAYRNFAFQP
jgi:glycosyltransferase involved in cell wall biosynthesis